MDKVWIRAKSSNERNTICSEKQSKVLEVLICHGSDTYPVKKKISLCPSRAFSHHVNIEVMDAMGNSIQSNHRTRKHLSYLQKRSESVFIKKKLEGIKHIPCNIENIYHIALKTD